MTRTVRSPTEAKTWQELRDIAAYDMWRYVRPLVTVVTEDYTTVRTSLPVGPPGWEIVIVDSASPVTVTLAELPVDQQRVTVKVIGTGGVTVATAGSEKLDDCDTMALIQYDAAMFLYPEEVGYWILI